MYFVSYYFFFFFQAEDGIRDRDVTGVQTCALSISIRCCNTRKILLHGARDSAPASNGNRRAVEHPTARFCRIRGQGRVPRRASCSRQPENPVPAAMPCAGTPAKRIVQGERQ